MPLGQTGSVLAAKDRWSVGLDKADMCRFLTSTAGRKESAVVCAAADSSGGVYSGAQYLVHHLEASTNSDQVLARRLAPKARLRNQNKVARY